MQARMKYDWWKSSKFNVTNTYLRTHRKDWFQAVDKISSLIKKENAKSIVDIGAGDGHTTRQILAYLQDYKGYVVDIVEPCPNGLELAQKRLENFPLRDCYLESLEVFLKRNKKYDVALAIHSNYYWGTDEFSNLSAIKALLDIAKTVIIMSEPSDSDYYKALGYNPFCEDVFTENIVTNLRKEENIHIQLIDNNVRMYVGDLFKDSEAASEFLSFLKDEEGTNSIEEIQSFVDRVRSLSEDDYLSFKDQILVIKK